MVYSSNNSDFKLRFYPDYTTMQRLQGGGPVGW